MIIVFDNNDFLYDLFPQVKEHGQNRDADKVFSDQANSNQPR
jgi:hypothetical protein